MELKIISRETMAQEKPTLPFKGNVRLSDHVVQKVMDGKTVHEFIGTDDFASIFYKRQEYEVDAGRDEEPTLYEPLYRIINDESLPEMVAVNRLGPAGMVFQRVVEGGEVKFGTLGESSLSVPIYHHAVGIEYSDDLVVYNKLFSITEVERETGSAYNALLNHLHLYPFLSYSYASKNKTDGTALAYEDGIKLPEAYLRTLEAAITHAVADKPAQRKGQYALLVPTANLFTLERAFTVVPQQGLTVQSSALSRITTIIAYDGWSGEMGHKTFDYPGVSTNKAYLISLGRKARNHRSYVKHGLRRVSGNPDVSRFILEQTVWDARLGVYCNPADTTEEITLPQVSDLTA